MKKYTIFIWALLCSTMMSSVLFTRDMSLFQFVETNNLRQVKRVVKNRAALNQLNDDGKTVLDIAVERGYKKIARHLLHNGAKVSTFAHAVALENYLESRAVGFFFGGLFLFPFTLGLSSFLWIGAGVAMDDSRKVQVL